MLVSGGGDQQDIRGKNTSGESVEHKNLKPKEESWEKTYRMRPNPTLLTFQKCLSFGLGVVQQPELVIRCLMEGVEEVKGKLYSHCQRRHQPI